MSSNPTIWQLAKPFTKHVKAKAKISSHFTIRLYQRFDLVDRLKVLLDLNRIITSKCWQTGLDIGRASRLSLNHCTVVVKHNGTRLELVTIWPNVK